MKIIGPKALKIVKELTFDPSVGSKSEYLKSFANKSIEALIGKIADRICNTQDFLLQNPRYAIIYYLKAESLMDICRDRLNEIVAQYGTPTYNLMVEDIYSMYDIIMMHKNKLEQIKN